MATFNFAAYLKKGYLAAVGKMEDYWVIHHSSAYYDKGVLTTDDMAEISLAIDKKNARLAQEEAERLAAEEAARLEAEQLAAENEEVAENTEEENAEE